MTKRRILFYMITSIAVGIFLAAVTGAALGYFDAGNEVLTGRPVMQVWQALSGEHTAAGVHQAKGSPAAERFAHGSQFAQSADQLQMESEHFCMRGDDG